MSLDFAEERGKRQQQKQAHVTEPGDVESVEPSAPLEMKSDEAPREKTVVQEEQTEKKPLRKKREEDESSPSVVGVEQMNTEAHAKHVQSERNARRRQHRELHRQVELRKEAATTADEKSLILYGLSAAVTKKALYKRVRKIAPVVY
jgi:nucleolar protein 4